MVVGGDGGGGGGGGGERSVSHRSVMNCSGREEREGASLLLTFIIHCIDQGIARTQSPTNKNNAPESSTFEMIAHVNQAEVQWKGLSEGEPPT